MFRKTISKISKVFLQRSFAANPGPIVTEIRESLVSRLNPVHIEIVDHSNGSESHLRVFVVSDQFKNLSLIRRHRMVTELVKTKLDSGAVHALSIETLTPDQWKPEEAK